MLGFRVFIFLVLSSIITIGCSLIYPWYHYSMFNEYKIISPEGIKLSLDSILLASEMPIFLSDKKTRKIGLLISLDVINQSKDTMSLDKGFIYANTAVDTLVLKQVIFNRIKVNSDVEQISIPPSYSGSLEFYLQGKFNYSFSEYKNLFLSDTMLLHINANTYHLVGTSFKQKKRLFEK